MLPTKIGGTLMRIEEIYKNWMSLFPLSEKHAEMLRNKFKFLYAY